jgi:phasin family protein
MAVTKPVNFFETDITKIVADFKVTGLDLDAVMASQKRNIEAMTKANQLAFEGIQAVARRQSEIARQLVEESNAVIKELMSQSSPQEKVAKQADVMRTQFEKNLANLRELTNLLSKSNDEASAVLSKRFSEGLVELKQHVQKAKKVETK